MWSLLLLFGTILLYLFIINEKRRRKYPSGPYPFPFIGNIFNLNINAPELTINEWRDKYGKIFTIWLPEPIVVLADGKLMETTFGKPGEVANANIMHKLVFGGTLKDNDEIMRLKIAVENVFMDWYKPSWMLLEVMPWLIWLEKFKIYDFGVKRAASYNDVFITFLEHHIKIHKDKRSNGNTEENDYVDCFLAEMEKNSGQGFEYWQFVIACYDLWAAGVETVTTTLQFAILYLIHNQNVQNKLKKELNNFHDEITVVNLKKLNYLNAFVQEVHRLANVIPLSLIHETLEQTTIENYKFENGTCVIAQLACFNLDPSHFPNPMKFEPERHLNSLTGEFAPHPLLKPFSIGKRSCLGESLAKPQLLLILTILFKKYRVKSLFPDSLPNINARPGLVRVLDDFECLLVEED
uniref:Cytochrome P450 n=1 Tax=Panagrolaimus superbus TaxID=310955 RepID=A0A914YWU5_9BILA